VTVTDHRCDGRGDRGFCPPLSTTIVHLRIFLLPPSRRLASPGPGRHCGRQGISLAGKGVTALARRYHPVRRSGTPRSSDTTAPRRNRSEGEGPIWLFGVHAVRAALANGERMPRRLLMTAEVARDWQAMDGVSPSIVERREIDGVLPPGAVHQGIALMTDPLPDIALEDFLAELDDKATVLVLDQVTDPHNVGAILRSSAAFGAAGIIVQDRHSAPLAGTVAKAASGALEQVPVIAVTNLARALRDLQQADFWCVGLDGAAPATLEEALGPGRNALVLGAEGDGLRRLTGETCDQLARLPTEPNFPSLNVSNAAAVALYIAHVRRNASP